MKPIRSASRSKILTTNLIPLAYVHAGSDRGMRSARPAATHSSRLLP